MEGQKWALIRLTRILDLNQHTIGNPNSKIFYKDQRSRINKDLNKEITLNPFTLKRAS